MHDVALASRMLAVAAAFAVAAGAIGAASADSLPAGVGGGVEIAAALPLSGDESSFGQGSLEGIELAIEEADADRGGPHIDLTAYDDKSSDDEAKAVAAKIVNSRAIMVLGPALSTASLAAGPLYAQAGLPSITTTATSDAITDNPTTFRVVFKNSEQGVTLANYLARVLRLDHADVVVVDNKYGHTLQDGFQAAAERLRLDAHYFVYGGADQLDGIAHQIAADQSKPLAVVLLTLDSDAAQLLTQLRRLGVSGPFLGDDALGDASFGDRFAGLPEEARQPGYFTDGVYGISPMILDSANADTLDFAKRFRARFGRDPIWFNVAGYDAGRLAVAASRAAAAAGARPETAALRAAALDHLKSLNSPAAAIPALLGPLWFDVGHGRQQAVRIGRFNRRVFESAPVQIVPVTTPDTNEVAASVVFETAPDHYARLQRVVYTGVFLNEIPRVDLSRSSFGVDLYLWFRYARDAGPGSPDPTDIVFPTLIGGITPAVFDREHPAEQETMPDGTEYRLWRVQGEFRNDFDLHRFPFDRQSLLLTFFNARAAADRIVYVLDERSPAGATPPPVPAPSGSAIAATGGSTGPTGEVAPIVSPAAFRNLTQWTPLGTYERRENLVTASALGNTQRAAAESYRELSGFLIGVNLERRALATVAKTLLPLGLMTLIMFASLYFPHALVKEKVTVAITGALSGAVLLTAINNQLGAVGYTMAVEYVFFVFFGLSVLCIVAVLAAERLRASGHGTVAATTEQLTRIFFVIAVVATVAGAAVVAGAPTV